MTSREEPWYLHAALYLVIAILVYVLIRVAVIEPNQIVEEEKYYRTESRLRMENIKEAELLYHHKYDRFTGNLDSLINFLKTDPIVDSVMTAFDSLSRRPANPFVNLSHGEFTPDSLYRSPKSQTRYILEVDTTMSIDTVINRTGKVLRIDSTVVIGSRYYLEDPDGYGTIGSLDNDALKNTASWE